MSHNLNNVLDSDGKFISYSIPGMYEVVYYTEDGGLLCACCANAHNDPESSQWNVIDYDTTDMWDDPEWCSHCQRTLGPTEDY